LNAVTGGVALPPRVEKHLFGEGLAFMRTIEKKTGIFSIILEIPLNQRKTSSRTNVRDLSGDAGRSLTFVRDAKDVPRKWGSDRSGSPMTPFHAVGNASPETPSTANLFSCILRFRS
jgi:hypothetical protein